MASDADTAAGSSTIPQRQQHRFRPRVPDGEFHVIYACSELDRYVLRSRVDPRVLIKLSPEPSFARRRDDSPASLTSDDEEDEIVRSLWPLDPDGTLFSLTSRPTWGDAVARSLKSASIRDLLAAPEDMKDMETGKERRDSMFRSPSYSVRVTVHAGTDLQKLLYNPTTCPYCADQTPSGKVCIAAEHVGRFVRHILRGIQALDAARVQHRDLRLANLLVDMTESEIAEGVIRTSLPRITDFNCSRVVREEGEISDGRLVLPEKRSREDAPNAVTDSLNASGAIALFSTCKHGLMKLMRKHEGEDYVDAPNWLTIATQLTPGTTEDDRRINVDAVKMLDRLNSLSGTETLRDIIAIVDSATDADAGSSGIAPENKKRKSGNP